MKPLLIISSLLIINNGLAQSHYIKPFSKKLVPRSQACNPVLIPVRTPISINNNQVSINNRPDKIPYYQKNNLTTVEAVIGYTQYDLQTTGSTRNVFLVHDDFTESVVWESSTIGIVGSGYNFYTTTSWGPPTTPVQTTLPAYANNIVVTSSYRELIFSHTLNSTGLLLTSRAFKGLGPWNDDQNILGNGINDSWPRAISGGANGLTIHLICQGSGLANVPLYGQSGPILYSQSTDGGNTWPVLRSLIQDLDSSHYSGFCGDCYSIDAKGDTVAIVAGGRSTDLIMLKSVDNGITWTSTILDTFPVAFYTDTIMMLPDTNGDGLGDDIEINSGDAHVLIDNNGVCHVWFSKILIHDPDSLSVLSYYPNLSDGLYYWNETFGSNPPVIIAAMEDIDGNGVITVPSTGLNGGNGMGNYNGGATQMPSAGTDEDNIIYVVYQTFCELADTTIYPGVGHKHSYLIRSVDNGATWSQPFDISEGNFNDGIYREGVFPRLQRHLHYPYIKLVCQIDYAPGTSLSANITEAGWNEDPSDIVHISYAIAINSIPGFQPSTIELLVSNAQPNPAHEETRIPFYISKPSHIKLVVYDVLGNTRLIKEIVSNEAGNYYFIIDASNLESGLYYYNISSGNCSVTQKLMVH